MSETTDVARPAGGRDGFTLIEVLIAMVILAVGLLALEGMAIGAARQVAAANRTTEYTLIAGERLERSLDLVRTDPNQQAAPEDVTLPNGTRVQTVVAQNAVAGGIVWDIAVTVTPPPATDLNLQPVMLRGRYFQ